MRIYTRHFYQVNANNIFALLLFATTIALNASLFQLGSYALTAAPFASMAILVYCVKLTKRSGIHAMTAVSILGAYSLFICVLHFGDLSVDLRQFILSFCLFIHFVLVISLAVFSRTKHIDQNSVQRCLLVLLLAIFASLAVQRLVYTWTGNIAIFNFWGDRLSYHQEYFIRAVEVGAKKATAFYFEPSFAALVTFFVGSALAITRSLTIVTVTLLFGCAFLIGSLAGILSILGVLFLYFLSDLLQPRNVRATIIPVIGFVALLFVSADYLSARLDSASETNSSISYRIISPLAVIEDVLSNHVLGLPLGHLEKNISRFQMLNGEQVGNSLDTGWYLFPYHFGWPGLFAALGLVVFLCRKLRRNDGAKFTCFFFLLAPFFTGAIFSPEFSLLCVLLLTIHKTQEAQREAAT